jgi:DNA-binding MarR family transcriptional regulator
MDYDILATELVQSVQSIQATTKKHFQEIMKSDAFALFCISAGDGTTVPTQISDMMGVSTARVAAVLNSLEEKEMITRRIDSGDRRKIIVELTPKGLSYMEEHQKEQFEKTKTILIALGEEDSRELTRIVGKLATVLTEVRI